MAESIPSLWPGEFKIDVQTPLTILRVQAGLLGKLTRGILQGEVETETSEEKVQHRLVVIAPAYNGYRHTLVVASHGSRAGFKTAAGLSRLRTPDPNWIVGQASA